MLLIPDRVDTSGRLPPIERRRDILEDFHLGVGVVGETLLGRVGYGTQEAHKGAVRVVTERVGLEVVRLPTVRALTDVRDDLLVKRVRRARS